MLRRFLAPARPGLVAGAPAAAPARAVHSRITHERESLREFRKAMKANYQHRPLDLGGKKPNVFVRSHQGARVVTINRPQLLNALDARTLRSIRATLARLEDNDMVQVVVLKGNNEDVFSSGVNLEYLHTKAANKETRSKALEYFREEYYLSHLIATYTKPIVTCMHGVTLGSAVGIASHGKYVYSSDNSVLSLPETGYGLVPGAGSSYRLSRMKNGVGMYLGLTGSTLTGDAVFHAGVTEYFAPASMLDKDLVEHSGELHSHPFAAECLEEDAKYVKTLGLLRENRGEEKLARYAEELCDDLSKDDLEEFMTTQQWYADALRHRGEPDENRVNDTDDEDEDEEGEVGAEADLELGAGEKGDMFDFRLPAQVEGREFLPDPKHFQIDLKNALAGTSAHAKSANDGHLRQRSPATANLLRLVRHSFGGNPELGDPILDMRPANTPVPKDADSWAKHVSGRVLPPLWEASLEHTVEHYITDVYVHLQLVPKPEDVAAITAAVTAAVPRVWPTARLEDAQLDDLCHEFSVPAGPEFVELVRGGLVLVTARLLNLPPGVLVSQEHIKKQRQERELAVQRAKPVDEAGNVLSEKLLEDPSGITDEDLFAHVVGTPEDSRFITPLEISNEEDVQELLPLRAFLGRRAGLVKADHIYRATNDVMIPAETPDSVNEMIKGIKSDVDQRQLNAAARAKNPVLGCTDQLEDVLDSLIMPPSLLPHVPAIPGDQTQDLPLTLSPDDLKALDLTGAPFFLRPDACVNQFKEFVVVPGGGAAGGGKAATASGSGVGQTRGLPVGRGVTASQAAVIESYTRDTKDRGRITMDEPEESTEEIREKPSREYLQRLSTNPDLFIAAWGLPRNFDTVATANKVTKYFVNSNRSGQKGLCQPKSVEEIVRRLKADDTPLARSVLREMKKKSQLALKSTHRLIVEASITPDLNTCFQREYRVISNLLKRPETLAAMKLQLDGNNNDASGGLTLRSIASADVDSVFARLPAWAELTLPLRHNGIVAANKLRDEEVWMEKLGKYWESGEAPGYIGTMFRERYDWL